MRTLSLTHIFYIKVKLEALEREVEMLQVWDRVSKLCDTNEANKESSGSDTDRMRKLFIQLKNEPLESTRGIAVEAK